MWLDQDMRLSVIYVSQETHGLQEHQPIKQNIHGQLSRLKRYKGLEAKGNVGMVRLMELGTTWVQDRQLSQLGTDRCTDFRHQRHTYYRKSETPTKYINN